MKKGRIGIIHFTKPTNCYQLVFINLYVKTCLTVTKSFNLCTEYNLLYYLNSIIYYRS